jgi:hypothetical protein
MPVVVIAQGNHYDKIIIQEIKSRSGRIIGGITRAIRKFENRPCD